MHSVMFLKVSSCWTWNAFSFIISIPSYNLLFYSSSFSPSIRSIYFTFSDFKNYYYSPACTENPLSSDPFLLLANATMNYTMNATSNLVSNITSGGGGSSGYPLLSVCRRDSSLLFLLLMLGTVWVAITLYNFNKTWVKQITSLLLKNALSDHRLETLL